MGHQKRTLVGVPECVVLAQHKKQICLPALTRFGENKLDCPTGLSPFFHLSLHAGAQLLGL